MAEEKKEEMTLAKAKTAQDWVDAYYGDDAIDHSKKNKIRHLIRVGQYSSIIYVISKNTKKAHTDFFDEKYTTIDLYYSKAAEIIVKLLRVMYAERRPLTPEDFANCGGEAMFGGRSNYDQICEDYIGKGGLVEMCDSTCFPRPSEYDLLEGKEKKSDLKKLPKEELDRRICKQMASLYGAFVEDLEDVKTHHADLVVVSGTKDGVLSNEFLKDLMHATTDKGAKMQRELKGKLSALDFKVKGDIEEKAAIKYEVAKNTTKVAALAGSAIASIGMLAGGMVFMPAFLIIPTFALAKRWIPNWVESLGKDWGNFEKTMGHRFERQKIDSYYYYMKSFMATGGHPKLRLKDRLFLTPGIIKCLKKGSKSGMVASTYEDNDGEIHESEVDRALKPMLSKARGSLINDDNLHPVDNVPEIQAKIAAITPENATFEEFSKIADRIKNCPNVTPGEALNLRSAYAEKLKECAKKLIFQTDFVKGTDHQDKISKFLSESFVILEILKDCRPDVIEEVKRFVTFASKELTGFGGEYIGGTLENYIMRLPEEKMKLDDAGLKFSEKTVRDGESVEEVKYDFSAYSGTSFEGAIKNVLQDIANLALDLKSDEEFGFVVRGTGRKVLNISQAIANIRATDSTEEKKAEEARDLCNQALNKQMTMLSYAKTRADSRVVYGAILGEVSVSLSGESRTLSGFGGKLNLSDLFEKFKEVKYESLDTFSLFYDDMGKMEPPAVRDYTRGKFAKQVYDVMKAYVGDHRAEFETNLKALSEYLKKVNGCRYLNEQQKLDLSSRVSKYVEIAFGNSLTNLSDRFVEEYDTDFFANCLKSYQNGGFAELFASDQSKKTQLLKFSFEYMRDMQSIYKTLKFNDQFDLDKEDAKYIAKTLLTDRTTGEPPKLYPRKPEDNLIKFINSNIKNMSLSFSGTIDPADEDAVKKQQPYDDLVQALNYIKTNMKAGDKNSFESYDAYTALLILKNKCISLFRLCMKEYVQASSDGYPADWINKNRVSFNMLKGIWETGIMADIQDAINEMEEKVTVRSSAGNITAEAARYGTGNEAVAAYGQKQL